MLDQVDREFEESLMEALKVRRMSASDGDDDADDEVRMKNVEMRERRNGYVQVIAIGGETVREYGFVPFNLFYISVKSERKREDCWMSDGFKGILAKDAKRVVITFEDLDFLTKHKVHMYLGDPTADM